MSYAFMWTNTHNFYLCIHMSTFQHIQTHTHKSSFFGGWWWGWRTKLVWICVEWRCVNNMCVCVCRNILHMWLHIDTYSEYTFKLAWTHKPHIDTLNICAFQPRYTQSPLTDKRMGDEVDPMMMCVFVKGKKVCLHACVSVCVIILEVRVIFFNID